MRLYADKFSGSNTLNRLLDDLRLQLIKRIELWKSIARSFVAEQSANVMRRLALDGSITQSSKAPELEPAVPALPTKGAVMKNDQDLPQGARELMERYALEMHAELQQLDSDFQARFADAKWPENLELLKEHCLQRFNRQGEAMLPASVSSDATSINPLYALLLDKAIEKTLEFLSKVLQNSRPDMKADVISWVDLKLSSRKLYWLACATREHLNSHPAPVVDLRSVAEPKAHGNPKAAAGPEDPSLARPETTPEDVSVTQSLDTARIIKWMDDEGYTNETLAEKLHTSPRAVSSMRNAGGMHGDKLVTKLANLMNCDPDDLYR
jgi:hypothetical protein